MRKTCFYDKDIIINESKKPSFLFLFERPGNPTKDEPKPGQYVFGFINNNRDKQVDKMRKKDSVKKMYDETKFGRAAKRLLKILMWLYEKYPDGFCFVAMDIYKTFKGKKPRTTEIRKKLKNTEYVFLFGGKAKDYYKKNKEIFENKKVFFLHHISQQISFPNISEKEGNVKQLFKDDCKRLKFLEYVYGGGDNK